MDVNVAPNLMLLLILIKIRIGAFTHQMEMALTHPTLQPLLPLPTNLLVAVTILQVDQVDNHPMHLLLLLKKENFVRIINGFQTVRTLL